MKLIAAITSMIMIVYTASPLLHEMVHHTDMTHEVCQEYPIAEDITGVDCCNLQNHHTDTPQTGNECCDNESGHCTGHCHCMLSIAPVFILNTEVVSLADQHTTELTTVYASLYRSLFSPSVWQPPRHITS